MYCREHHNTTSDPSSPPLTIAQQRANVPAGTSRRCETRWRRRTRPGARRSGAWRVPQRSSPGGSSCAAAASVVADDRAVELWARIAKWRRRRRARGGAGVGSLPSKSATMCFLRVLMTRKDAHLAKKYLEFRHDANFAENDLITVCDGALTQRFGSSGFRRTPDQMGQSASTTFRFI